MSTKGYLIILLLIDLYTRVETQNSLQTSRTFNATINEAIAMGLNPVLGFGAVYKIYYGNITYQRYSKCSNSAGGSLGNYCPGDITFNSDCAPCPGLNLLTYAYYLNTDWKNLANYTNYYSLAGFSNSSSNILNYYYQANADYFLFGKIGNQYILDLTTTQYLQDCPTLLNKVKNSDYSTMCTTNTNSVVTKFYNLQYTKVNTFSVPITELKTLTYCDTTVPQLMLSDTCYYSYLNNTKNTHCLFNSKCYSNFNAIIYPGWHSVNSTFSLYFNQVAAFRSLLWSAYPSLFSVSVEIR
jgi:hypothetical protein